MKELCLRLPASYNNYYEPFIGGGALFFALIPDKAIISDINLDLIITYKVIKDEARALIELLAKHKANHSQDYYYAVRKNTNSDNPIEIAARFIYLNKTCYNGLYRVNSKGEFNVPMGAYINPNILDENNIIACSKALQNAEIIYQDFGNILPKPKDFVYIDPPYQPINHTSFTKYTKLDFTEEDQIKLYEKSRELHKNGVYFMLSNSDSDFIKNLYNSFSIDIVNAPRSINCKSDSRQRTNEVLIRNY
ncbi:MAG: Dam family site-specific DNA-(adenine-N6)-methyltransferase [Rickettsia endosymbiont of Glossina mortisans submortisans]|nr:Dam family site-specific DNA-(adenine-N6)-methyltransferase [Rickettsia endosymbiont of Glossina mortisans submortisans]